VSVGSGAGDGCTGLTRSPFLGRGVAVALAGRGTPRVGRALTARASVGVGRARDIWITPTKPTSAQPWSGWRSWGWSDGGRLGEG